VRIVRPASEAEVVATFLRGELESPRWGEGLRALLAEDGLDASVLDDPAADSYRAGLLDRHRGWLRRRGLFDGLPERIEWARAALSPAEVLAIRFIRWDWWLEISGGSRSPVEAAARIRRGEIPGVTAKKHEPVAARLRSPPPPAELIAVGPPSREPLVLLEGHVRLTAYALYPECLPAELELYVGTAPDIDRWSEF
jgi:hypothetical protein